MPFEIEPVNLNDLPAARLIPEAIREADHTDQCHEHEQDDARRRCEYGRIMIPYKVGQAKREEKEGDHGSTDNSHPARISPCTVGVNRT